MPRLTNAVAACSLLILSVGCGERPADVVLGYPLTTESEDASRQFMEGMDVWDHGDAVEAREHFRNALAGDSGFAMAHLAAAWTATSNDEYMTHYRKALELADQASEPEQLWIQIEQRGMENDAEGQMQLASRLVEAAPESPRALLALAGVQAYLEDHDQARSTMQRAIDLSPEFTPAYITLANSYMFREPMDYASAEENLRRVVELEPDVAYHQDLLGDLYRAQNNLESALEQYDQALALAPDKSEPHGQRAHVNAFLGNYDQARADYDAARELARANAKATYARYRAYVSLYAGDAQTGIAELKDLVTALDGMGLPEPRGVKINVLTDIVSVAQHHGMFDDAQDAMTRRAALMQERWEELGDEAFQRRQEANIVYWEGILAARRGNYREANAKATEFMGILEPDANPRKNEPAHFIMGLASYLQGDAAAALAHYEQSFPNNVYAKYYQALAHEQAGNDAEATALFGELASYNFTSVGYALIRKDAVDRASM